MMDETGQYRLAVLIDADNTRPDIATPLLEEVAKYGVSSVRRAYGDWTTTELKGWKEVLLTLSIQPIQQFRYTVGKNATDSAMIIDAMDLLYTNRFDGFCIVSSDSDFTRLASRIREGGVFVYGFGEKKTPAPFVGACDKFIYTEILRKEDEPAPAARKPDAKELKQDSRLINLLRRAVEDSADDDGWALLADVGNNVANKAPEFDSRNYGYGKLGELVRAIGLFEMEERPQPNSPQKLILVRDKRKR